MSDSVHSRRLAFQRYWLPCTVFVALSWANLATIRDGHDWGGDFALYLAHARNLVEGTPYGDTGYLYSRHNPFVSPPTYPPGFPLLLAPVLAVGGMNFVPLKVIGVVSLLLTLPLGFVVLRNHLHRADRINWMLLLGLSPYLWAFRQSVLSDLPFTMLVLACLGVINGISPGTTPPRPWWHGAVAGILMGGASALRTVGFVLPVAVIITALIGRGPGRRFVAWGCGGALFLLLGQNLFVHRDSAYLDQLIPYLVDPATLSMGVATTLQGWWRGWIVMWSSGMGNEVAVASGAMVLLLTISGFVYQVRARGWSVFEIFTLCYLAVVLVWPMAHDPRFLIPVMPMGVTYALIALRAFVTQLVPSGHQRRVAGVISLLLVLHVGSGTVAVAVSPSPAGVTDPAVTELFEFLRSGTDDEAVLIAAKPRVLALFTHRRSAALVVPELFAKHAQATGATHLVLTGLPEERMMRVKDLLAGHAGRWAVVFRGAGGIVYRIYSERGEPGSLPKGSDK